QVKIAQPELVESVARGKADRFLEFSDGFFGVPVLVVGTGEAVAVVGILGGALDRFAILGDRGFQFSETPVDLRQAEVGLPVAGIDLERAPVMRYRLAR